MILKRTFYPVGHGAFYVERFYDRDKTTPVFTAVFDCGCYNRPLVIACQKRIIQQIHLAFNKGDKIDVLFISHLHTDHINGVEELLRYCSVEKIVLPHFDEEEKILLMAENLMAIDAPAIIYGADWISHAFETVYSSAERIVEVEVESESDFNNQSRVLSADVMSGSIPSGTQIRPFNRIIWEYVPFNSKIKEQREKKLVNALRSSQVFGQLYSNGSTPDWRQLVDLVKKGHLNDLRTIMDKVFPRTQNEYSMTVLSRRPEGCHQPCEIICHKAISGQNRYCTLNCLYMGDFEPKQGIGIMLKRYDNLRYVGLIQIPHHGSANNYDDSLYAYPKICILSVDQIDNFGHPDMNVIKKIQSHSGVIIPVTEVSITEQVFSYTNL